MTLQSNSQALNTLSFGGSLGSKPWQPEDMTWDSVNAFSYLLCLQDILIWEQKYMGKFPHFSSLFVLLSAAN